MMKSSNKRPTADLLKNSLASPSLVAAILDNKYVNALPIYRMEQNFLRQGIQLSRQVMCNWVIRSCERYLSLMVERMKKALLTREVIQADESTVEVSKDGRKAGSKSYMWVYSTGKLDTSGKKVVLFDYQKTRATEHPRKYLEGYRGILVSDGYQSYHLLEKEKQELTVAGCYAHARRRFANAVKAMRKDMTKEAIAKTLAYQALKQIAAVYKIEEEVKTLTPKERQNQRNLRVKPLVEAFFEWIRINKDLTKEIRLKGKDVPTCYSSTIQKKQQKIKRT